jgi:hypothetical protein
VEWQPYSRVYSNLNHCFTAAGQLDERAELVEKIANTMALTDPASFEHCKQAGLHSLPEGVRLGLHGHSRVSDWGYMDTPGCQIGVTWTLPGAVRLGLHGHSRVPDWGYVEHTGYHQSMFWLSLSGVVLITWPILAVVKRCFDAQ